ncbi:MAG: MarR family winged helix-turn-helix transcriptional regulator [Micrococcales bacterium]|nr:MarR family winged helix-turn-helix transcriptional regulator [Micrococcales bacterium]
MPTTPDGETLDQLLLGAARALRASWHQGTAAAPASAAPTTEGYAAAHHGPAPHHGLAPHHGRALKVLGAGAPMRPGQLAERLRIAPRSATDVLDALLERGLAERSADPTDRRASLVELTDEGRVALAELERHRAAAARAFFADLTDAERADLARLLGRLQRHTGGADHTPTTRSPR